MTVSTTAKAILLSIHDWAGFSDAVSRFLGTGEFGQVFALIFLGGDPICSFALKVTKS
jgi:hypothetical protein